MALYVIFFRGASTACGGSAVRTVATVLGLVGGVRPGRASAIRRRRAATMIAYFRPRGDASATAPDGFGRRARGASRTKFPEESRLDGSKNRPHHAAAAQAGERSRSSRPAFDHRGSARSADARAKH